VSRTIVLLSGSIGSGKSTLCSLMQTRYEAQSIKTIECLRYLAPQLPLERRALQQFGESLDRKSSGSWIVEPLTKKLDELPTNSLVFIDSIRMKGQADAIRERYGSLNTIHIHLHAPDHILEQRYAQRLRKDIKELSSYAETQNNRTEKNVPKLARIADFVIDTQRCTKEDVLIKVACHLNLFGKEYNRNVDVLIGGQYGSEGKGQVANYLASGYKYLLRVGGPNAGHKVYEGKNRSFVYHSLPSGTRTSTAGIIIGPGATLHPEEFLKEAKSCGLKPGRLFVDPQAMIITAQDIENEKSLVKSIGSTGRGVGFATARRITGRSGKVEFAKDIPDLEPFIKSTHDILEEAYSSGDRVLLEGTQGTGLSLYHGKYPYVTSRDTSVAGCISEAGVSPSRVRKVIMVCRTYPIRVQSPEGGTSGDIGQEITLKEISVRSGISFKELKRTEKTSTTNRERRIAEFDWALLKFAASLNAPTDIALTFVDYFDANNRKARRFEQLTSETIKFVEEVERVAKAPASLISTRFHFRSIIDRRSW
jgi:adenylosuccinate synthase